MRSYRPEELFDDGRRARSPSSARWRPRATGGWARTRTPTAACCCATSSCPTSATTRSRCPAAATRPAEATRVLGEFLRDVDAADAERRNFRVFGPDETASNRLGAVFEATDRHVDGRDRCRATTTSRRTAASWRC